MSYFFHQALGYKAIGFIFLLSLLPLPQFFEVGPILYAAALSTFLWGVVFIPPVLKFSVEKSEDFLMILTYFSVATVQSLFSLKIKNQKQDLLNREKRSHLLYEFSQKIAQMHTPKEMIEVSLQFLKAHWIENGVIYYPSFSTADEGYFGDLTVGKIEGKIKNKILNFFQSHQQKCSEDSYFLFSLQGRLKKIGVVVVFFNKEHHSFSDQILNNFETMFGHLALCLERFELEQIKKESEIIKKSERLHQALLNSISHELRTPLTTILGGVVYLQNHEEDLSLNEKQILIEIGRSTNRLNRTIENLLDMSRVSNGFLVLKKAIFECTDFLDSLIQKEFSHISSHQIVFERNKENYFIEGDEKLLEHVFYNIILNSIQYSNENTKIFIKIKRENHKIIVELYDEGMGFVEEELPYVFDSFYRSKKSLPGGVGLGLALSKAIVELHEGQIFAKNRAEKKGAHFKVVFNEKELPESIELT